MGCLKIQPEPRAALYDAIRLKARRAGVLMMESLFKVNLLEVGCDRLNGAAFWNGNAPFGVVIAMTDPTLFNTSQPLRRVRQGAMIAGVCGGIARWLGWDPTIVRLLYVVATIASIGFPGILTYLILWLVMPRD